MIETYKSSVIKDIYAVSALVFLASLCCWHAIIGSYTNNLIDSAAFLADLDKYMLFAIVFLFLCFHLAYILNFLFKFCRYSKLEIVKEEAKEIWNTISTDDKEFKSSNKDKYNHQINTVFHLTKSNTQTNYVTPIID
jgi:hypothetical protein